MDEKRLRELIQEEIRKAIEARPPIPVVHLHIHAAEEDSSITSVLSAVRAKEIAEKRILELQEDVFDRIKKKLADPQSAPAVPGVPGDD